MVRAGELCHSFLRRRWVSKYIIWKLGGFQIQEIQEIFPSRCSLGAKRHGVVTRLGPCWPDASSACGRGRAATPGSLRQPSEEAGAPCPSLGLSAAWGPEVTLCLAPLPRESEPVLGCGQTCLRASLGPLAWGPVLPGRGLGQHLVFRSWSRIFFSISASVRVSSSGHH